MVVVEEHGNWEAEEDSVVLVEVGPCTYLVVVMVMKENFGWEAEGNGEGSVVLVEVWACTVVMVVVVVDACVFVVAAAG